MKQKVGMTYIYKISSKRLKRDGWDLTLDFKKALTLDEVIALGDSQTFRFIDSIAKKNKTTRDRKKFYYYMVALIGENNKDFEYACKNGFYINHIDEDGVANKVRYRRFVGTTGGVKKSTVLFIAEDLLEILTEKANNDRDLDMKLIPAKFEAYKALMCSNSIPVSNPNGVLVVKDNIVNFKDKVIYIDDTENPQRPTIKEIEDFDVEINNSDGFGLGTIKLFERWSEELELGYVAGGLCLRNAFLKGMVFPFDIVKFAEEVAGTYEVIDIWGQKHDVRDVELILTESMLKLWDSYRNIGHYLRSCKKHGYTFSVCKVTPKVLEDERQLNYQYLQSYDLSDEDIYKLTQPTIQWIKDSVCGDYETTLNFLGYHKDQKTEPKDDIVKALLANKEMMKDPYVIKYINRMIKKKITNAKIGKLNCSGNYQIISGDPYALMQSVFGLEVTGLLKANEVYSDYWINKSINEILLFRSPMTSHNNIRKVTVNGNDDVKKWFKYMTNVMVISAWDTITMALNGADKDGDTFYSTDNPVLIRNYVPMLAINCVQRKGEKEVVTEESLAKSNLNGFGNGVGVITNRVTKMFEVRARFKEDSEEYKELTYRITCGQLYQQNEIDKIKGIVANPMPKHWYSFKHCDNDFDRSICADATNMKPMFMLYIYPEAMKKFKDFKETRERKCRRVFKMELDELFTLENKTEKMEDFISDYYLNLPVGKGDCVMNKICSVVCDNFKGFLTERTSQDFNYTILKTDLKYTKKQYSDAEKLLSEYMDRMNQFYKTNDGKKLDKDAVKEGRDLFREDFKQKAMSICKNKERLCNILVDLCYSTNKNKQLVWDICSEQMIINLKGE